MGARGARGTHDARGTHCTQAHVVCEACRAHTADEVCEACEVREAHEVCESCLVLLNRDLIVCSVMPSCVVACHQAVIWQRVNSVCV